MLARTSLACAALAVLSLFAIPFGCGIDADPISQQLGAPCDATHPCDHDETCQSATCNEQGFCELTNLTKNPPDPTPFDCKTVACVDGALVPVSDPTDHQDDGPCVTYACVDGKQVASDKMKGLTCTDFGHQGTCDSKGVCQVPCTMDAQCEQTDKCTITFCDQSTAHCAGQPLDGVLTPGVPQPVGDCHDRTCVMGVDSMVLDTSDSPAADGPCNVPSCSATGAPTQTPKAEHTSCIQSDSDPGVCDATGHCVECDSTNDCPDPAACHVATCVMGKCGTRTTTTPPPNNVPCMVNKCTNGVLSTGPATDGSSCGNNGAMCKGGLCGCQSRADCPSGANNGNWQCAGTPPVCTCMNSACGDSCNATENNGCGGTQDCTDHTHDGSETGIDCGGGGVCPQCGLGQGCGGPGDCMSGNCVDGVCCDTPAGGCNGCRACSAAAKGQGPDGQCGDVIAGTTSSSCTAMSPCGMTGKCDGSGNCAFVADGTACGTSCANGNLSQLQCQTQVGPPITHMCSTFTTMGCPGGLTCADGMTCNGSCTSGGCPAGYSCVGGNMCKLSVGGTCSANADCANGQCVNNVCCSSPSCGTSSSCGACAANGNCAFQGQGSQPSGCNGTNACDGAGNCDEATGDSGCSGDGQCASGHCSIDGFCCSNACTSVCHTCSSSSCANASSGPQSGFCDATHGSCMGGGGCSCDSGGNCKAANGGNCSSGGGGICASGNCVDNTCCATSGSCGTCKDCKTGSCQSSTEGTTQNNVCDNGHGACGGANNCACDGSGACKRAMGAGCSLNGECASGNCSGGNCT